MGGGGGATAQGQAGLEMDPWVSRQSNAYVRPRPSEIPQVG